MTRVADRLSTTSSHPYACPFPIPTTTTTTYLYIYTTSSSHLHIQVPNNLNPLSDTKIPNFHGSEAFQLLRPPRQAPARVIAADGSLKELPAAASSPRVAVSDVLGGEAASSFLCNSDVLYFNEPPPALPAGELLQPGQIYFVLPAEALARPLSTADMASLAVRATAALAAAKGPRRRGGRNEKKVRVVPVQEELEHDVQFNEKLNEQTLGEFAAAKKSHGKLAARSRLRLKRALSIIQEMAD